MRRPGQPTRCVKLDVSRATEWGVLLHRNGLYMLMGSLASPRPPSVEDYAKILVLAATTGGLVERDLPSEVRG